MMRSGWHVEGDKVYNPRGEAVATIIEDLPAIQYRELIDHIRDAPRRAYHRGLQEGAQSRDEPDAHEALE